ncbi:MAG TPA: hypothetical protein VGO59_04155 [Verrucomicrobiae bacterium]
MACLLCQGSFGAIFTNLLSIDFEQAEGYSAGQPLGVQSKWLENDTNGSGITNIWPGMGQSAFIGLNHLMAGDSQLTEQYPITMPPLSGQYPYVSFSAAMSIQAPTTDESDGLIWAIGSTNGDVLFLLDFVPTNNGAGIVYWQTNGASAAFPSTNKFTNSVIYRLEIDMDFVHETWNASLSGRPITPVNLPIGSPVGLINYWWLLPTWHIQHPGASGNEGMYFDHLRVVAGSSPPSIPQPALAISETPANPPIAVSVQTEPGLPYALQFSTNLHTWSALGQTYATNLSWVTSNSLPAGSGQRFYRAFAAPE